MTESLCRLARPRMCSLRKCPQLSPSARLVGHGFRLWLSGYKSGDVSSWEKAWQLYSKELGPRAARTITGELSCWVRSVSASATREIELLPETSAEYCRDECLAISMIAACQHKTCPAIQACAFALIESSYLDEVIERSECFASTLLGVGQSLPPNYIVNDAAMSAEPQFGQLQ